MTAANVFAALAEHHKGDEWVFMPHELGGCLIGLSLAGMLVCYGLAHLEDKRKEQEQNKQTAQAPPPCFVTIHFLWTAVVVEALIIVALLWILHTTH